MPERLDADFRFGGHRSGPARRREEDPTLRIVVLADLRGRAGRQADDPPPPMAQRSLMAVDVDTFDAVLARLAPRLELHLGGPDAPALPMVFRRLDDFHPDALYRGLELFRPLRDIRHRLLDTSTFAEAAAAWAGAIGVAGEGGPAPAGSASPAEADEATRRRLLGRGSAEGPRFPLAAARAEAGLERLLGDIVAPYVVPSADRRLPELLRSVDETAAALLRALLHHPSFQALESAWRSLHGLVTELEAGAGVELRLLDVTRAELQADAATSGPSALEALLVDRQAAEDAESVWPLFVAGSSFGPGAEDVMLLDRLGAIAARAGGPVLAAAHPGLVGCRSFVETPAPGDWKALDAPAAKDWRRLRESASAAFIGLAMPRILLRLPYGQHLDPVESFDFEEVPAGGDHEAYLWGNPAFACARLIASSFIEDGAAMDPGNRLELADLPAAVHDDADGPRMKPCAEIALSDAAAERILDAGVIPLLASSRRNLVRIMRMQSVAHPPRALAGRWGRPSPPSDR